jgi:hypothetical protein
MEFNADAEFSGVYLQAREALMRVGWKESHTKREGRVISTLMSKDGYGIFLLYGCEEEIKDEII